MKTRNLFIFSALSLFLWVSPLQAEIQSVQFFWRHGACRDTCTNLLAEKLREIKEVESVSTSTTSNMANIKLKKNEPFSYQILKFPFQRVGVGIDNVRVVVKGTLTPSQNRIVLVSSGDNTNFDLVSLTKEGANAKLLNLDPKFKQPFLDYAKDRKTLIVEGALYQPHRSPPLYLLVEKVTLEEEKKEN